MLHSLLVSLLAGNDMPAKTRRRDVRRESDRCVCLMYGRIFPVSNWSFGGLFVAADERMFGIGQDVDMVVKFKLRNTIVDINLKGHVVRKNVGGVGIQFEPLTQMIRRNFQQVIDDQIAREFANSPA